MIEKDIEAHARAKMNRSKWLYWFPPRSYGRERDIFGVFDVLVLRPEGVLFLQLTSIQHISDREKKILAWMKAKKPKMPFCSIEVWAWDKQKSLFVVRSVQMPRRVSVNAGQ